MANDPRSQDATSTDDVELIRALNTAYQSMTKELSHVIIRQSQEVEQLLIAIDDEVHGDPAFQRLEDDSEIHFVPRLRGG